MKRLSDVFVQYTQITFFIVYSIIEVLTETLRLLKF